jgi:Ran GTPase-activating protein (RanGAP) involved in mRNA processing and transport
MCKSLLDHAYGMNNMKKLTLSRLALNGDCLDIIGDAVLQLSNLQHLDLSANGLARGPFVNFFVKIDNKNQLRSLNIAYNSLKGPNVVDQEAPPLTKEAKKKKVELVPPEPTFEEALSKLMHYSPTLLHLDLSGTNLSFESCLQVAE